jgi:hypothetical protein
MGRKAFGPTKKRACDTRRDCKKKKQPKNQEAANNFLHHAREL